MISEPVGAGDFIARLRAIAGAAHVLTGAAAAPFATGFRFGGGTVEAAVRPGSLVEMWHLVNACVAADRILIMQAANTGLTGGSTPNGVYDRPVVVLSTGRIAGIRPIREGEQVIALPGSTLYDLEKALAPLGREPHSVIGSSCIGASVVGGVCNNSGGALVRRGPAYTEYALFAQVEADGSVHLRNHLGIRLGDTPEEILERLDQWRFDESDVAEDNRAASAADDYGRIVRDVDADTPARFNADPSRLYEASGSAGKVVVFAVRLDTFPRAGVGAVFYIGTNDTRELGTLRRRMLAEAPVLPISGEYLHREAFDLADRYGKDTIAAIRALGTDRLPGLFRAKAWVDRLAARLRLFPASLSDLLLQAVSRILPDQLPRRMRAFRERYAHHLILKVADEGIDHARALLSEMFPSASGAMFECTPDEGERAMLHRFVTAGAAVRCRAVRGRDVEDIVALDIALPRNAEDWLEVLPPEIEHQLVGKLYYGHFFCHVFHQDYLVAKGCDPVELEHRLLDLAEARGAEYPAEHNVGHLYAAKPALAAHYRSLDPHNALNPGIGHTSRLKDWQ
ncbi:MAG TPA: D-lactate dehydrogenase [Sphingomonas sp.]|nr:D-lactate dehydrogenase [Sphingomonas sp.]